MNALNNSTKKCHFLRMCYKGMFGHYIVWHPVCRTGQSASHFTPWHSCSFQHKIGFSGKHSAMLQLLYEDNVIKVKIPLFVLAKLTYK